MLRQVKEKLLAMAQDSCQRCLNDMHARTAKLSQHPSTLSDFCAYMVRSAPEHPPYSRPHWSCGLPPARPALWSWAQPCCSC